MKHVKLSSFLRKEIEVVPSLGWFGLASDPPTLAHRKMVDAALGSGLVKKVVVFPAADLPYKSFHATDFQRLDMLGAWKDEAEYTDDVIISHFDIMRDTAMLWKDLWKKISSFKPQVNHYLIVGSDQYLAVKKHWEGGEELYEQAQFLIIPRAGYEITEGVPEYHKLLNVEPVEGSSSGVRSGELYDVDDKVRGYILETGLYNEVKQDD
ncbi:MAG: hypothetical protein P1V18_00275 [Candidatus Gracilibacteria bacterium]|nr:hypothetical protein [Candidatus Gracilibacteria bacterium]